MNSLYLSNAVLASYDGDVSGAPVPQPAPQPQDSGQKYLTQDDFNRALAEDRRKHQTQVQKAVAAMEEAQKARGLTEQEREALAQQVEDLKRTTQTVEQLAASEREKREKTQKDYEKRLAEEKKNSSNWERRYKEGTVQRALMDAAVAGDAFNTNTVLAVSHP